MRDQMQQKKSFYCFHNKYLRQCIQEVASSACSEFSMHGKKLQYCKMPKEKEKKLMNEKKTTMQYPYCVSKFKLLLCLCLAPVSDIGSQDKWVQVIDRLVQRMEHTVLTIQKNCNNLTGKFIKHVLQVS